MLLNIIYLIAKNLFYVKINIYKVYKSVLGKHLLRKGETIKNLNIYNSNRTELMFYENSNF